MLQINLENVLMFYIMMGIIGTAVFIFAMKHKEEKQHE